MQVIQSGTRPSVARLFTRTLLVTTALIATAAAHRASAQGRVVSACSGVQLPPSAVTGIIAPVLTGITGPIESSVNGILGSPLLTLLLPQLSLNTTGLLNQAASGAPITLQVLGTDGTIVGPSDQCQLTSDSISLDAPAGISIGGNRIAGLGADGVPSFASDVNAIAFGNNARAEPGAAGSVAFGTNSNVTAANSVALGANSVAGRGALAGYTAVGLTGTQASAGEVSVGAAGALRQITNVAAGSDPNDAATVGQVTGVANQVATLATGALQYDDATRTRATLAGLGGTVLGNVGAGAVTATSTEAVNGSQLFATNARIDASDGAIAGLDTRVATNTGAITTAQADIGVLQGQAANAVRYDTDGAGVRTGGVTLAGATPGATVTLGNVGAGALTATSTDAVNGSQLFATNTQVAANTAAVGGLDTRVTGNTAAIGGLDTRVTTNTTDIAALQGVTANAVSYDTDGAGVRTGTVTLAGTVPGATATLTNVGPGALAAGSTDAVNGSQLFATNTQVTANTTDIAALQGVTANAVSYDTDGAGVRTGGVTLAGTTPGATVTLGNVGAGALTATSTDAVNGSQLFATNTQVATNTGAIGVLDTRVNGNTADIAALQGTSANAVSYDVDAAGVRTGGVTLAGAAPGQAVTIGNVAAGTLSADSTQAVNGSQLFATNQRLDDTVTTVAGIDTRVAANTAGLTALGLSAAQYDNVARDRLTFAGAAGTVLGNVAAGEVSATSAEAVNGSQLFATNTQVAANTAAIASIGNGSAGPVRYSTPAAPTTPNGGTITDDLTLTGASGGAVALHNVAGGVVAAGSTDAVNGGQLDTTNQAVAALDTRVAANTGAIGAIDTRVTNNTTQIATNTAAIIDLQNNAAGTGAAITNLTTRVDANTTAITDLQTQVGNQPLKYADAATPTTPNGGALTDDATLVGASGGAVGLRNIRAGAVVAGSTDAINGGQLADTNTRVTSNTTAITDLRNTLAGSTVTAVQYSNADTPTAPNGGTLTNDVTLIGADPTAAVALHNVAGGSVAAGSTDAVNGGQLFAVATQSSNSLQYDRDASGARTNQVTLAGGTAAAPVTLANVAAGAVAAGSTQAVNGGQLFAASQTAQAALALGSNSVQYDGSGNVTLGNTAGTPVALRNVAAGTAATDAVNLGQLQSGMRGVLAEATGYIDSRLAQVGFDLGTMRRDMSAGSSAAMAVAALPQAMEPGATMIAIGGGTYRGQSAVAFGASRAFNDGRAVVKVGGTYDSRGYAGANAGVGFQF